MSNFPSDSLHTVFCIFYPYLKDCHIYLSNSVMYIRLSDVLIIYQNIAYTFVLTCLAVPNMSCLSYLDKLWESLCDSLGDGLCDNLWNSLWDDLWDSLRQNCSCTPTYGRKAAVSWSAASRIGSKQFPASLYRSHLTFSLSISFESKRCRHDYSLAEFLFYFFRKTDFYPTVNSSPYFISVYVDTVFSRWDIATEVYELVN